MPPRTCPDCGRKLTRRAKFCPDCGAALRGRPRGAGSDEPPDKRRAGAALKILIGTGLLAIVGCVIVYFQVLRPPTAQKTRKPPAARAAAAKTVSVEKGFASVKIGATFPEVKGWLGDGFKEMSAEKQAGGGTRFVYEWETKSGRARVTFEAGKAVAKEWIGANDAAAPAPAKPAADGPAPPKPPASAQTNPENRAFTGTGYQKTEPFTMSGPWTLRWKSPAFMTLMLVSADGATVGTFKGNNKGEGESLGRTLLDASGTFHLLINATGKWTVKAERRGTTP